MLSIDLSGRTALVLGGSRGIGAGITEALCRAGAYTVFTHTGNPENAPRIGELKERIKDAGGRARAEKADALNSGDTTRLVEETVKETGSLDILVCNVGKNTARPVTEISDDIWREFM
ncbi:MAG: SDR family NAD(P)-dependent oxidoreductase, partial [Spirochaetales bacterium]